MTSPHCPSGRPYPLGATWDGIGVNFALLSLFNALERPVQILQNDYSVQLDRCLHSRFKAAFSYRRVYIDFDETLIAAHRVHGRVMDFLYQCRNKGVEIVLITKHREDLATTLREREYAYLRADEFPQLLAQHGVALS